MPAFYGRNTKKSTEVSNMKVNYAVNPMGTDDPSPMFYWTMPSPGVRGQKQSAYRIQVASTPEGLESGSPDMWDSGKVESGLSAGVRYGGAPLQPSTRYYWTVTVWDADGKSLKPENYAWFETGLMDGGFADAGFISRDLSGSVAVDTDLSGANWIWLLDGAGFSSAPKGTEYFRKSFLIDADRTVSEAILIFTADDYGKVYLNGELAAEAPNSADRWKTGNAADITGKIKSGANLIAAEITNSAAGYGGFICKIRIKYADGDEETCVTDESWKVSSSRADGFADPDFDDCGWKSPDQAAAYGSSPWGNGVIMPAYAAEADDVSAPTVRKTFSVNGAVAWARLYATAAGLYTADLNGERVGDCFLTPGFTEYGSRLMYQTFDVTSQIRQGDNTLSAALGNGWYIGTIGAAFGGRYPAFMGKLVIAYEDGSRQVIDTDESWEITVDGPVTANDLFDGETYDARKLKEEFVFEPVVVTDAAELNIGKIVSQTEGTAVKCMDTVSVKEITSPEKGTLIYDFGQNLTGVLRITVNAPEGTKITIRHGEMLNDGSPTGDGAKGTLYTENLRSAKATDVYICRGGEETWNPEFTYHGFRYAEITGIDEEDIIGVEALVLYSALEDSGTFECSSELINQLASNAYWGQRSNFLSVPTDCPQRDERMGWSGDAQIFMGTAAYNMDVKKFFEQYVTALNDCQRENGAYPDCAPATSRPGYEGSGHGGWADAGIIIPYTLALRYGDLTLIETYYDNMVRYINYLIADAGDYIRDTQWAYGDWLALGESTPVELCDTAYCAYVTGLMSKMAGWLGRDADSEKFAEECEKFKEAWNGKYLKADGSTFCDTQTSYVLGLHFGIIPQELRKASASRLNEKIISNGYRLSTGFMGVSYLLFVLCGNGYEDTAFRLLTQTECPSWLYPVTQGATTIWERWDSYTSAGFGNAGMNSYNHYSYGSVMEWVYTSLVGITCDPEIPAYKHFILAPTCGGSLAYAEGSYRSAYGLIESGWRLEEGDLIYECTVPANTTATLKLPCKEVAKVYESGKELTPARYENGRAVFELEPGSYSFRTEQR